MPDARPLADPPDARPLVPRLVAPPGAWDCQLHIFGPVSRFGFHPESRYVSQDRLPEEAFAMLDRLGLARAVFVAGAGYGADTGQLEHVMERHADRLAGVALMPGDAPASEFGRLSRLNVRALRFMNPAHGAHVPVIDQGNARRAVDAGWHIHYYPWRTELAEGVAHLLALPGGVVLDHFAHIPAEGGPDQPAMDALCRLLDTGRFWVKLSGPMRVCGGDLPYAAVTPLARRLVAHRPDRMLWASDWPHMNMVGRAMPNDAALLDLLLDWVPDAATRDAILAENPRALFG